MSSRRVGAVLGLLSVLWAAAAHAQRVVVLEFTGDRGQRLRAQVEEALLKSGKVEVFSLTRYRAAAVRKGVKPERAMTARGVAELAPELELDAAVDGTVGEAFLVQILAQNGEELWSRELPITRGGISSDNARRLAAAIEVAAKTKPPPASDSPPAPGNATLPTPTNPPQATAPTEPGPLRLPPAAGASSDSDFDFALPPGPRFLTIELMAAGTFRGYCARPGVTSCAEYDNPATLPKPFGEVSQFSTKFPYIGGGVAAELFPFVSSAGLLRGLGFSALYTHAYSRSTVQVTTPSSTTPPKSVVSLDRGVSASLLARFHFRFGFSREHAGHVGLRAGGHYRGFDVDPDAAVTLAGTRRLFPSAGLDVSLPVLSFLRLELGAEYFLFPDPGLSEREAYGDPAHGRGIGARAGLSGDIWGPLGYVVRARFEGYADTFIGVGTRWANGGVAEELYLVIDAGLTAHF